MPVLDVEVVGLEPEEGLAAALADAAAAALGSAPEHTWVRLRALPAEQYAEGGGGPPQGVRPVFVTVLKREAPRGAVLRDETEALTNAVARACGRPPDNVHVLRLPDAAGRAAFGGTVVD